MKDVIGQAMMAAKLEQQQQQQQQHHLSKRAVTKTDCSPPANLEQMFQEINSKVSWLKPSLKGPALCLDLLYSCVLWIQNHCFLASQSFEKEKKKKKKGKR